MTQGRDNDGLGDGSRRRLLALSAAAVAAPVLAPLVGCARRIETERRLELPAPVDGKVRLSRAAVPELNQVGSAVLVAAAGAPAVLVASTTWGFVALKAACTHAACEVSWVSEDQQAECPCHGSRFASDGTALAPPATGRLTAYAVSVDPRSKDVVVDLRAVLAPGGRALFGAVGADGTLLVTVADHPELAVAGGSVTGYGPGLDFPLSVVRLQADWAVFDATCPHQSCAVEHLAAARSFSCPCHGSRFDEGGKRLSGPAAPGTALKKLGTVGAFDPAQVVVKVR